MRSSIACIRCRRSKVKCVNTGVGTTCRACDNTGRDCSYPAPVPSSGGRRRESSVVRNAEWNVNEGERRVRPRKSVHTFVAQPQPAGTSEVVKGSQDVLDPRILTPAVWQELFDIFQLHYSADLPFLHPPSFLAPLRHATENVRPAAPAHFLLAFLALTSRFHTRLVAHYAPDDPTATSDHFASAAHSQLALKWSEGDASEPSEASLHFTQALLMLGLHEWGMCRGVKAWLVIGGAIRSAQAQGLQYEQDLDDEPMSRSLALPSTEAKRLRRSRKGSIANKTDDDAGFVLQEIRRRTFWSCFIMDRYLSSGKYRPQMLHAQDLRIQLPASEKSFLFGEKVLTKMLGEEHPHFYGRTEVREAQQTSLMTGNAGTPNKSASSMDKDDEEGVRTETGDQEGLVSRYIKILEIYGKVVRWSCAGGRRAEKHPPWSPRSQLQNLLQDCHDFKASLPRELRLNSNNLQAHNTMKTSTPYTLVHTVYLLCQIMLHREYLPFIPIRCSRPEGPLDEPLYAKTGPESPPDYFWEHSAGECFKAARQLIDHLRLCQGLDCLVETPIVGFAIYTAAFVGVYAVNFPWMDWDDYMCSPPKVSTSGAEAATKAVEMLGQLRSRLHMAIGWFRTINRMHKYFTCIKNDYRKNTQAMPLSSDEGAESPMSTRHLSLREGRAGGGLEESTLFERTLNEFGALEDQEIDMADGTGDDSSANTTVKSEEPESVHGPTPGSQLRSEGMWNAVNHAAPGASPSRHQNTSTPTNGQFRSYESYPQYAQAQPAPPAQSQRPFAQQINNFRPAFGQPAQDGQVPSTVPSLTSPDSHTASTPSDPSPPYDQHNYSWSSKPLPNSVQPPPTAYQNGTKNQAQIMSVYNAAAPNPPQVPGNTGWDPSTKEAWLNSLYTRIGGDDLAAFVDGGELADYVARESYEGGWLSAVWNGVA